MDGPYIGEPERKQVAKLSERLYLCKNKIHYIYTAPKDDAVWCQLCNKLFCYDECELINEKTGKPKPQMRMQTTIRN